VRPRPGPVGRIRDAHLVEQGDRILVAVSGGKDSYSLLDLLQAARRKAPVQFVSRESAELAKYASNAFLAMKISFINEVADLCETVGADIGEVANAVGADGRIGPKFLHAGPGYGGSCFPKDVTALVRTAREAKSPLSLIEQVEKVNTERKIAMAARVAEAGGGSVRDKTIAVLGVTFKPNTDDMRESPSLIILPWLQARGAKIRACDPQGAGKGKDLLPGVVWAESAIEAAQDADAVVVLTEWNEFRALDLAQLRDGMRGNILVDLRNVYSPTAAAAAGFVYHGIGRGMATSAGNGQSLPSRDASSDEDAEGVASAMLS